MHFSKMGRLAAFVFLLGGVPAQAQAQTALKIHDYPGTIGTLARIAIEKGFCEKNNLQCSVQTIATGALSLQALVAGSIDIAGPAVEVAIQASAAGADLKIIGGGLNANPFMLFVGPDLLASADKGYPQIMADLKGKKIGVTSRGSAPEFQMKSLLLGAGMNVDDVTFVPVGSPNTVYPALLNKQIDAAMSFLPLDGICEVTKTCRIALIPAKGQGPSVLTNLNGAGLVYVVRRDFAQKNPAAIDAFGKAMREAQDYLANPANAVEVKKITDKYYKLEMADGDEIVKSTLARFAPFMKYDVKKQAIQAAADYLLETKQLNQRFDAERLF